MLGKVLEKTAVVRRVEVVQVVAVVRMIMAVRMVAQASLVGESAVVVQLDIRVMAQLVERRRYQQEYIPQQPAVFFDHQKKKHRQESGDLARWMVRTKKVLVVREVEAALQVATVQAGPSVPTCFELFPATIDWEQVVLARYLVN